MSIILLLFILGISLSMDTFSVALSIGTFNISKKNIIIISLLVGIMHFIMPFFGYFLGNKVITFLQVNVNLLLGIILLFIAIEMLISLFKEENNSFDINIINSFLISGSVSLDSFSTGFGLKAITDNILLSSTIFSICALSFTFMGFIIGKYSSEKLGKYANILGIMLLIVISLTHII